MDSPLNFPRFPLVYLSILFYTIFHKKASQNQKGKDCLQSFSFLVSYNNLISLQILQPLRLQSFLLRCLHSGHR
ncbi:hypothetical protein GEZ92_00560 [Streptococcus mitis]|nr:hypothetical protein [Streptococcus mitis]MQQ12890.1 hypothetical protein [Streptococcus mitis]MQQ43890.1 hypothetical protein [Streptococcus mitis]MQQ45914.1 hypothetical protein [Streptococcus mitis]MQQ57023.1 hypothetical protein [Streptococcus mitis]